MNKNQFETRYRAGSVARLLALALMIHPLAFSLPALADPSAATAGPVVPTGTYPGMSVGQSGTASQSGTSGFLVHSGTSYGALGASGTGGGSAPTWNGSPIVGGVSPGARLFDSSDLLEIDLGARHFFFGNGSAVAIDISGTGQNPNASLSFNGPAVYTESNTLDDGSGGLVIGNNGTNLGVSPGLAITAPSGNNAWMGMGNSNTQNANFGYEAAYNTFYFGIWGAPIGYMIAPTFLEINDNGYNIPSDDGSGQVLQVQSLSVGSGAAQIDESGDVLLNNSFQSGAPTPTGYLIIYDNTGTPYYIPAAPAP